VAEPAGELAARCCTACSSDIALLGAAVAVALLAAENAALDSSWT
jgi:hypothetical protein